MTDRIYLLCKHCGDIIHGDFKGTFIQCSCGKIAVDQTDYYCRIIGNEEDYTILHKDDEMICIPEPPRYDEEGNEI